MPNQKKGKATPKSTPSKGTPKPSPKTRGKVVTPKKAESPASQKPTTPQRGSRSSTPSKAVESPKPAQKKAATPTKVSPKPAGKQAKTSPKGKAASPKSNKTTPKKVASPKSRKIELSEESSEDENTEFKVGDLIDAQWDDNLFYSAKVIKVNKLKSGNTYNVEFTQDKVVEKNLKRNQIQSYTDDSEGEVSHKHKASNDDQEYVEGEDVPLRYDDESVESDSTEQPRTKKAGRKPATKRKREATVQAPTADKKRKLAESLAALDEKQLFQLLKKACASNVEILETVEALIPEPKPAARAAPKKSAEKKAQKTAPQKAAPKITATKKGKNVATKKAAAKKGTTTRSGNK